MNTNTKKPQTPIGVVFQHPHTGFHILISQSGHPLVVGSQFDCITRANVCGIKLVNATSPKASPLLAKANIRLVA